MIRWRKIDSDREEGEEEVFRSGGGIYSRRRFERIRSTLPHSRRSHTNQEMGLFERIPTFNLAAFTPC